MSGSPVGSTVRLRRAFGVEIRRGDLLITKTDRRYHVQKVRGRTLTCLVVDRFFEPGPRASTWLWTWLSRTQRNLMFSRKPKGLVG